jgi:hypothetical protein
MDPLPFLNRFAGSVERGVSANQRLCLICEAQTFLLDSLADSAAASDRILEEISAADAELAALSSQISKSKALLSRALAPRTPISRAGPILQLFLTNTEKAIHNIACAAVKSGENSVRMDAVLDIEGRIADLILSLKKADLFPESEEDSCARTEAMEQHNERLARFLRL